MGANRQRSPKSYMKLAAKRVTIQKPQQKLKGDAAIVSADGFTRISETKIRKTYK